MKVMQTEDFEALHQLVLSAVSDAINHDRDVPPVVLCAKMEDHQIAGLKVMDVSPFQDEEHGNKDALAAFIQMLASQEEIDLVAYVSEAWMVGGNSKEEVDTSIRPSEHPDRKEAVVVSMLSHECQFFGIHHIERNPSRLVPGSFGPAGNEMQGRFAREQPPMH